MSSWSDKKDKLSKFYACKSPDARKEFLGKLSGIESKYDCKIKAIKIGDRAARIELDSNTMKDYSVSKAIDSAYNGVWDVYRGTTKEASILDLFAGLGRAGRAAVRSTPVKAVTDTAARATRGARQFALDKGVRAPRDFLFGYGTYGRSFTNPGPRTAFRDGGIGRVHQLNKIHRELGNAPITPGRSGARGPQVIRDRLDFIDKGLDAGNSATYNNLRNRAGIRDTFRPADHMTGHMQGVKDLTGNTGLFRQLYTGSPLGLRGRTPLRYEMQRAMAAGDWEYAAALGQRMKDINRNRLIGAGAAGAGLIGAGMYQAAGDSKTPPKSNAPEWVQTIANLMAGVASPVAPTWAQSMRDNPWATAGVGGAAGLLGLYLLLARNNNNRQQPMRSGGLFG